MNWLGKGSGAGGGESGGRRGQGAKESRREEAKERREEGQGQGRGNGERREKKTHLEEDVVELLQEVVVDHVWLLWGQGGVAQLECRLQFDQVRMRNGFQR